MKTPLIPMITILAFLAGGAVSAQMTAGGAAIDSVRILGAPEQGGAFDGVLLSRPGGPLNDGLVGHDAAALTTLLRERGWLNGSVAAYADSSAGFRVLVFWMRPGRRTWFGDVRIEPETDAAGIRGGTVVGFAGKPFTRSALDSLALGIVTALAAQGFPDAEVVPSPAARGDSIAVTFRVRTGARAAIDSIAIRGLVITKDRVIRRQLVRFIGKPVTPGIIAEVRATLEGIGFVRVMGDPSLEYAGTGAVLVVRLAEGGRGSFDGAAGYQPSGDGGSGEMVGKADVSLRNLFGTGRAVRLVWENLGTGSEDMEFRWDEPWVFGFPADAYASFGQERRDAQSYTRTLLAAGFGRNIGRFRVTAGIRREHVSADTLTSSVATGVETGAGWTSLDAPVNPRSGFRIAAAWSLMRKEYREGNRENTSLIRTDFTCNEYVPTVRNQTVAVLLSYRSVDSGAEVPDAADRLWIGGASTLRGYREKIFPADRAVLASVEYRVLTGETSRVFVFTDAGYLRNREAQDDLVVTTEITRIGYGFGMRLQSRAGMLGFDYGLGRGDSPGDGKLHVRLSTEF